MKNENTPLDIDRTSGLFFLERAALGVQWHNETRGTWLNKQNPADRRCSRRVEFMKDGLESICIEPDCPHERESLGFLPYTLLDYFMAEIKKMEAPGWTPPKWKCKTEVKGQEIPNGNCQSIPS